MGKAGQNVLAPPSTRPALWLGCRGGGSGPLSRRTLDLHLRPSRQYDRRRGRRGRAAFLSPALRLATSLGRRRRAGRERGQVEAVLDSARAPHEGVADDEAVAADLVRVALEVARLERASLPQLLPLADPAIARPDRRQFFRVGHHLGDARWVGEDLPQLALRRVSPLSLLLAEPVRARKAAREGANAPPALHLCSRAALLLHSLPP
mmetsp:Transcript_27361/g.90970  ORF Transcript_27361/g.90970 Transcript_27361/m.90970 type:complete len:207 (+) Transcript_27361:96-716(+)